MEAHLERITKNQGANNKQFYRRQGQLNRKMLKENELVEKFRAEKFVGESLKNEQRRLKDEDL